VSDEYEPKWITLTRAEVMLAARCGVRRHVAALFAGLQGAHGVNMDNAWSIHIEGACGELAFCRCYDLPWSESVNTFKAPDVGKRIQVRTRSLHDYDLLVRDADADDEIFQLVTGRAPRFAVRGAMLGAMAKRNEFKRRYGGRDPAYFVPQKLLAPTEFFGAIEV
jgi:hypothetical protein